MENDQNDRCIVTASLPVQGEYGLEIYGNDPAKDGDTYTHICQYFVHFDSPDKQAKAFYQESPERQMRANPQQATMDRQYQPDSVRVSCTCLVPYKFYVLGQIGLSKQCRPRSDCF